MKDGIVINPQLFLIHNDGCVIPTIVLKGLNKDKISVIQTGIKPEMIKAMAKAINKLIAKEKKHR